MTRQQFFHLPEKMFYLITPRQLFFTRHLLSTPAPLRLPQTRRGCLSPPLHPGTVGMPAPVQSWWVPGTPCPVSDGMGWDGTAALGGKPAAPALNHHSHGSAMGGPAISQSGGREEPPQAPSLAFKRQQHRHGVFVNDFLVLLFSQNGSTARLVL